MQICIINKMGKNTKKDQEQKFAKKYSGTTASKMWLRMRMCKINWNNHNYDPKWQIAKQTIGIENLNDSHWQLSKKLGNTFCKKWSGTTICIEMIQDKTLHKKWSMTAIWKMAQNNNMQKMMRNVKMQKHDPWQGGQLAKQI